MSDEKLEQNGLSRRSFLGTAAASGAGIAGAGLLGLAGCSKDGEQAAANASGAAPVAKAQGNPNPANCLPKSVRANSINITVSFPAASPARCA